MPVAFGAAAKRTIVGATMVISTVAAGHAQSRGVVAGTIMDVQGVPVAGAQISVRGAGTMAISDARGVFQLDHVPVGPSVVRVRRLGFRPESVDVQVPASPDVAMSVTLASIAAALSPVVIRASR